MTDEGASGGHARRPGERPRIVFIAGPTAGGKTRAALDLAERLEGDSGSRSGAEIVNADAMQLYRDLPILAAQPTAAEKARAPHHLFGAFDGAARLSAGRWARAAKSTLDDIARRGRSAIVVGGTGLYFRALEHGLAPIPDIPDDVRAAARARFEELGAAAFREAVLALDPAMARLDPGDMQRHLRAYEVATATGRPLSSFHAEEAGAGLARADARVVIEPDRAALYARIEARFDAMLAAGALDEAAALLARGLHADLPVMKALGAAELMAHLRGEIDLETAVDRAKTNTRRFAKRQLTWFRNQAADWPHAKDAEEAVERVAAQLR